MTKYNCVITYLDDESGKAKRVRVKNVTNFFKATLEFRKMYPTQKIVMRTLEKETRSNI